MEQLSMHWSRDGKTAVISNDDGTESQLTAEELAQMAYLDNESEEPLDSPFYSWNKKRDPYESKRWSGLKKAKNFLTRKSRDVLYEKMKEEFTLSGGLRGYYSSLLELTYVIGDYAWTTKAGVNRDVNEVPEVIEMLDRYKLDKNNLEAKTQRSKKALQKAFDELSKWSLMNDVLPLDQESIKKTTEFLLDRNRMAWLRKQIRDALATLDTSIPPKSIRWLMQTRLNSESRRKKKA